jgi:hypothetical protein
MAVTVLPESTPESVISTGTPLSAVLLLRRVVSDGGPDRAYQESEGFICRLSPIQMDRLPPYTKPSYCWPSLIFPQFPEILVLQFAAEF